MEQTSSRELAKHRRAGLVAERRAAKAERRGRRADASLLRRRAAERVSAPLESGGGDEPAVREDDVLADQEQHQTEQQTEHQAEHQAEAEGRVAEHAAAQEAEAARESEREAAEREAEEHHRAEQAEAERLATEQAELEAAAEAARAKAEQAEQRERARQAKEAEREQAKEAKDAERERRRAEKARAAAVRRRDPVPETDAAGDDARDDVPAPPDEVGPGRTDSRARARSILALVAGTIGALGLLFSVLLAVGALLVAIGIDSGGLYSIVETSCDVLTALISGLVSFSGENADKKEALVTWGLGSMAYLAIGLAAQSVLRARTESVTA